MDFAAANAAATTRLSVGNEEFSGILPLKYDLYFVYVLCFFNLNLAGEPTGGS